MILCIFYIFRPLMTACVSLQIFLIRNLIISAKAWTKASNLSSSAGSFPDHFLCQPLSKVLVQI